MSTVTPNLGLVLYDTTTDQAVTFFTFRAVWGGTPSTSNFYKIDTAYGNLSTRISSLEDADRATPVYALFSSGSLYTATGISSITAYNTGISIILSVDTTTNGAVTLNINSLGVKSVMKVNSSGTPIDLTGSDLSIGRQYLFIYDGTRWLWVSANTADQIKIVGTSGNVVTVNSDNTLLGTTTPASLIASATNGASSKSTPVDADEIPLADSAASYALKKLTWANIKATLNAVYAALGTLKESGGTTLTVGSITDGQFLVRSGSTLVGTSSGGSSFWNLVLGSPVRASNTTFTVTGDYTSLLKKGMVLKWTESSSIKVAMISIPSTYSAPNTTVTIIGDTMASIDSSSLKYAVSEPTKIMFPVAGTIGATGTDVSLSYYAEYPYRVIGADLYTGTAGTTNSTTVDINKNGTTMFATKPTLATTVAASPTPFTADNGTSLSLNDKVTIDVDAIQTTSAIDLYVKLYLFAERLLYLT